jgi:predicted MFS family arabinose efflux permease
MTEKRQLGPEGASPSLPESSDQSAGIGRVNGLAGLSFVSIAYMLNYVDRQMLSVLIEPIKREIDISDSQIGLLTGTLFAVFYTLLSLPIAVLADRVRRIPVVSVACFAWSVFTGLSGLAATFLQMAIARIGVAVGEAGGLSPSLSLISDYYPPRLRARAVGVMTAFAPIGVMIGAIGGGLIAEAYGWRMAFIIPAVVGVVVALAMFFLAPEPVRGAFDRPSLADQPRTTFVDAAKLFFKMPSLAWAALSGGLCAAITNAALGWFPALMMRGYGASLQDVALFYGPVVGLGLMCGAFASGWTVSALLGRSVRVFMLVPAGAMLFCAPLLYAALSVESWQLMLAISFPLMILVSATIPPIVAFSLEVAPPDARSTTSALLMVIVNLIGIGIGPLMVGAASDFLRPSAGDDSLRLALLTTLFPTMLLATVTLYVASRYIGRDRVRAADGIPGPP